MRNLYVNNLGWMDGWDYVKGGSRGPLPDFEGDQCMKDYEAGFLEGMEAYNDRGCVDA